MSIEQDLQIIDQRMRVTGIRSVLPTKAAMDKRIDKGYKKYRKQGFSKNSIVVFLYRQEIAKVLKQDLMWLSKWCFDVEGEQSWVEECHETAWKFLNEGESALPQKYKDAVGQGAFFCYDKNASVEGVEMPRGVGKTFTFSALRAVKELINNPSGKWLIAHSDKFKAQKNLTSIKTLMLNPYLSVIFPEFFHKDIQSYKRAGGQVTAEKINITFNEIDETGQYTNYRPEATYTVASPQIDRTGYHVDGIFADDLVTDETSRTPEATEKLYQYYRSLWGLRQLGQPFRIFITGTEWWENSLYTILKNLGSKVTWFQMPAKWEDRDGKDQRLSRHHSDEYLEEQKVQMKQDYEPQMLMQPRRFGENLKLVDDERSMLFSFYGEDDAPSGIATAMFDLDHLKRNGCIVSSLDPSYSSKGKVQGSNCSTATLINGVITGSYNSDKVLYIYKVWQKLGWDLDKMDSGNLALSQMYKTYADNTLQEEVDWTVCDALGTQKATIQDYFFRLQKHVKQGLRCSYHEKGSQMSAKGKSDQAKFVLQEKFANNQIKIHWSLQPAIDQIMRRNSGFDILDVLVQLCLPNNIDWNIAYSMFSNKDRNNLYSMRKKKKRKVMSKVANY